MISPLILMIAHLTRDHSEVFSQTSVFHCLSRPSSPSDLPRQLIWHPPPSFPHAAALGRALQEHILQHHDWWRPGETIARPLTLEEIAYTSTPDRPWAPQPLHSLKTSPAAAQQNAAKSTFTHRARLVPRHVPPVRTQRRWDMQLCLCEVRRLCSEIFDGISSNTRYRWKRSSPRAAPLGRNGLVSPADITLLSEHIMRVTDVLCLSAVTIRSLVLEWLFAEGLDVRPCRSWMEGLLRGMRLSYKKPAKCVKELHSRGQHHANTHHLFIKLCWLMDKHAVSADRVVNIDETSCRLLPVHQIGWGRRAVKKIELQGNTKEATTFTVAFHHGSWPAGHVVADRARWQDRRRLAGAALLGAHSSRHVGERLGNHDTPSAHGRPGRRDEPGQGRATVDPSLGHGQHPRQRGHHGRHMKATFHTSCSLSSRRTALRTCRPAA